MCFVDPKGRQVVVNVRGNVARGLENLGAMGIVDGIQEGKVVTPNKL